MASHITLINYLIQKYNYKTYLEIGCQADVCFSQIKIDHKVGVDPATGGTVKATSDDYFQTLDEKVKFDIIFIDGLHFSEQVDRDIKNSLKHLTLGGTIVIHDCNPPTEDIGAYPYAGSYNWTGDVWKAIVEWRVKEEVDICVGNYDWGCGVLRVRPNSNPLRLKVPVLLDWQFFEKNRDELLNLKTVEEVEQWL